MALTLRTTFDEKNPLDVRTYRILKDLKRSNRSDAVVNMFHHYAADFRVPLDDHEQAVRYMRFLAAEGMISPPDNSEIELVTGRHRRAKGDNAIRATEVECDTQKQRESKSERSSHPVLSDRAGVSNTSDEAPSPGSDDPKYDAHARGNKRRIPDTSGRVQITPQTDSSAQGQMNPVTDTFTQRQTSPEGETSMWVQTSPQTDPSVRERSSTEDKNAATEDVPNTTTDDTPHFFNTDGSLYQPADASQLGVMKKAYPQEFKDWLRAKMNSRATLDDMKRG